MAEDTADIVDRLLGPPYPSELRKEAAAEIVRLREKLKTARADALTYAARIARDCCLVPPDGGAPTEAEREMCSHVADVILAHIEKETNHG